MRITDGAKIFIKNETLNKYLFVLRDNKPNIPQPNKWSLFGGGIENGESPIEAVKRELSEEINIDVFDIEPIYSKKIVHEIQGEKNKITGYYFIGKTNTDNLSNIILNEGQKVSFFSLEEINQKNNVTPSIKELIKTCENKLK
ncbi:NUDIX domain-containing protein [Patescibacteria group bacterium]